MFEVVLCLLTIIANNRLVQYWFVANQTAVSSVKWQIFRARIAKWARIKIFDILYDKFRRSKLWIFQNFFLKVAKRLQV